MTHKSQTRVYNKITYTGKVSAVRKLRNSLPKVSKHISVPLWFSQVSLVAVLTFIFFTIHLLCYVQGPGFQNRRKRLCRHFRSPEKLNSFSAASSGFSFGFVAL